MTEQTTNVADTDDLVEPANNLPEVTVTDLPQRLQAGMERAGWNELTPVQAKAMPYIMAGRDLMVQSRTGSGKTGAFIMPIIEIINPLDDGCQALVLVPTRELAQQVAKEAQLLAGENGLRTIAVYGGVGYGPQLDAFRRGDQLVVGTPGRILDHLLRKSLSLKKLKVLVFDEADRMLSMGFYPDMLRIKAYLPDHKTRNCMFSATLPVYVQRLARQFLIEPDFLSLSRDRVHVTDTDHIFYTLPEMDKVRALIRIIEMENPSGAIIFCNTKMRTNYVTVVLRRYGYDADELSGDVSQKEREKVMARAKKGKLRFLVATDVAARGIDIPELSHVIQYEVPEDVEIYVHRAGRTGRAGATGDAITLIEGYSDRMKVKRIAKQYKIDFEERPLPTRDEVTAIISERTTALLETKLRERDKLRVERMARLQPLLEELLESEEGRTLLTMLLDDFYQASLHSPPELPLDTSSTKQQERPKPKKGRNRRKRY